jgi:hypothetical protein
MRGIIFAIAAALCLILRWALTGRHVDATPLLIALAPFNAAAFSLRRAFAWTRGTVNIKNEPKTTLFAFAASHERGLWTRERELRTRYKLDQLRSGSTAHNYRENLYILDVLDRHASDITRIRQGLAAVDVGSQDFRYAFGLARFLGPNSQLTGIELEGNRIYKDLHSRKDYAEAYVAQIDNAAVNYEVKDFLTHDDKNLDIAFFFFPFVLEYALLRWGLPRRFFDPTRIFHHAHKMLRPGGTVVVMNHTEAERVRQVEILEACGFDIVSSEAVSSDLIDYSSQVRERSLTIARKARWLRW